MRKIHDLKERKVLRKQLRLNATTQEIILWSRLKSRQLGYKFRRQHSIGNYIVDFYCPEKKLIIELDGWQHKKKNNRIYDNNREIFFRKLGFKMSRFWNNDVNENLDGVILKIEEFLG